MLYQLKISVLDGWERTRKGKKVQISSDDIIPYLFSCYKRNCTRIINKLSKKYKEDPQKAWKECSRYFLNMKEVPDGDIKGILNFQLEKIDLCKLNINDVIDIAIVEESKAFERKKCVQQLMKPKFRSIKIQSIDQLGFQSYVITKFQYAIRNFITDQGDCSILSSDIGSDGIMADLGWYQQILQDTISILKSNIDPPKITSKTICIKFSEQIYKIIDNSSATNPISIHLKPYNNDKGFFFEVTQKTIDRLREYSGDSIPVELLFKTPPVIQTEGRKVIINQPLPLGQENLVQEQNSPKRKNKGKIIVLGVDLGLIHFAVVSVFEQDVKTGVKREIARYFIDQKELIGSKFNCDTLKFEQFSEKYNIKGKLRNLNKEKRKLQYLKSTMENDGGKKRTIKYYHISKRLDYVWNARKKKHNAITQKLAHVLIQMAKTFDVRCIAFEDLRWAQHSKKRQVGQWLARNQINFFHSQIISRTQFLGLQKSVDVKLINAKWTSKICWKSQLDYELNITWNTQRELVEEFIGIRNGKNFSYFRGDKLIWQGDSDLNAARNVALRCLAVTS